MAERVESRFLLATYFVSATLGLDSNPGTSDTAAFKTLQKAANTARAGDTVHVRAGTYAAGMNLFGHAGGRAGSPVTFLADPGATITGAATSGVNASMAAINIENTSWIVVQGFNITDVNQTTNRAGIRVAVSPNCVIRNNTITGAYNGVFASRSDNVLVENNVCRNSYGEHGIYVNGSANYVIRGNETDGNPWNGIHTNVSDGVNQVNTGGLIENNVVHDNDLAGMDLTGISNAVIRNNLVYGNGRHAVVLQNSNQEATVANHDVTFVNNTFDAREGSSAFAIQFADLSSQPAGSAWTGNDNNMTIFNNILIGNQSGAYGAIGTARVPPASFKSDYNVTDGRFSTHLGSGPLKSLAQWRTATSQDAHSSTATAAQLFVNAGASDYHLRAGAPALDVGIGSFNGKSAPAVDAQGHVRPQGAGYDAGYDELPAGDTTAPIATVSAADITLGGAADVTLTVTYTDNTAVDVSSLDSGDLVVRTPGGAELPVTFLGVDAQTDGSPRITTYRLAAPGGSWEVSDNGSYSVQLVASQVRDASGNFASAGAIGSFIVRVPSDVVGRWLCLDTGNSNFVVQDKQALRPGAGAGTFANYTGDVDGLTAIAIDVNKLPAGDGPSASSFTLRNGNGTSWNTAPAPSEVIVRRGGGANGSDRVILTWPAGAIRNTWLEVTVNAEGATGLSSADVFYFGSLAGDTGDATGGDPVVNVRDFIAILREMNPPATDGAPGARFDFNHDAVVNASDLLAARSNAGAVLPLFRPSAVSVASDGPASRGDTPSGAERRGSIRPRRVAYQVLATQA